MAKSAKQSSKPSPSRHKGTAGDLGCGLCFEVRLAVRGTRDLNTSFGRRRGKGCLNGIEQIVDSTRINSGRRRESWMAGKELSSQLRCNQIAMNCHQTIEIKAFTMERDNPVKDRLVRTVRSMGAYATVKNLQKPACWV
jgi:hypothetical protein